MRRALTSKPQEITSEQFSEWKRDPVTETFLSDLLLSTIADLSESLPEETDIGTARAYKRDGNRETVEFVFEWKPENIKEIEEGDHD